MHGIELVDNIIVASGSIVTKSFMEEKFIMGGNTVRKIGTWDDLYLKSASKSET